LFLVTRKAQAPELLMGIQSMFRLRLSYDSAGLREGRAKATRPVRDSVGARLAP
jgi:hypothetical protein